MFGLTPYNRSRSLSRNDDFVDFYNMIDSFFSDSLSPFRGLRSESFKLDVKENAKEYCIEAELPGYGKGDIRLDFDDGRLLISVSRQNEKDEENERYIHRERSYAAMQRGVYLQNVDGENIIASFENGVLKITVPKLVAPEKRTQIPIQ